MPKRKEGVFAVIKHVAAFAPMSAALLLGCAPAWKAVELYTGDVLGLTAHAPEGNYVTIRTLRVCMDTPFEPKDLLDEIMKQAHAALRA